MSGNGDTNDDDYVAKLLAEDAKKSSVRYASAGLSALLPKSSRKTGPKPNTRFLSHLVRDVDSHNAALKRKEEIETRSRLEVFRKREREEERQRASELARKRRRIDTGEEFETRAAGSRRRERSNSPDRHRRTSKHDRHVFKYDRRHHRSRDSEDSDDDTRHRDRIRKSKHAQDSGDVGRNGRLNHEESFVQVASKHKDQDLRDRMQDKQASMASRKKNEGNDSAPSRRSSRSSLSDPLEDLVGPLPNPPPQIRGRGRHSSKSNIDSHFSSNYNPNLDVHASSPDFNDIKDSDDWDMALEALRDRTAWKRKQADRLKEAGFTAAEIEKWERGAMNSGTDRNKDGDVETVRWKKKGEGREWDRGKEDLDFVDQDEDPVRQEASKRRLKDSTEGWSRKNNGFLKDFKKALG